jgi:MFS family permease
VSALRRSPALWVPALTVLFCFLVEGSMDIWSGLYLREELGASPAAAGAAFVAFAGALFVGRLFAARVLFELGPRRTILISGIGGGIGGTIAVLADATLVVAGAFLLMGSAMSAAGPAGFSLVEETTSDSSPIPSTCGQRWGSSSSRPWGSPPPACSPEDDGPLHHVSRSDDVRRGSGSVASYERLR